EVDVGLPGDARVVVADGDPPLALGPLHPFPLAAGTEGHADGVELVVEIVAVDGGDSVLFSGKVGAGQSFFRLTAGDDADLIIGQIDARDVHVDIAFGEFLVVDAR